MVFTGIERAKFRRPIVPGDQIRIEVDVVNWRVRACKMEGKAYVDGKLACEAVIMCAVVPRTPEEAPRAPQTAPQPVESPAAPAVLKLEAVISE